MSLRADTRLVATAALLALAAIGAVTGNVWAAFHATTNSAGNRVVGAPDWVAPTVSSSVIRKTQGGTPGFIHQGGTYNAFAAVSDTGNPASGIASAAGNMSTLTTGQGSAPLTSGSFAIAGTSYNVRTGTLTADSTLAAGTYAYSLTSADAAGNQGTQTGYFVIVDNTAPTAADVQTTNKTGNVAGRPDIGDTVTFTFSEPIDPESVLPGWTGAATSVVARIERDSPPNNRFAVYNATNATQLPLGTVNLGRPDYVAANTSFGASGTSSTMIQSGNAITITLGTASGATTTTGNTAAMIWTASALATDRAGNAEGTTARTETGAADKDF